MVFQAVFSMDYKTTFILVGVVYGLFAFPEYYYPMPNNTYVSSPFGYRTDPVTGEVERCTMAPTFRPR